MAQQLLVLLSSFSMAPSKQQPKLTVDLVLLYLCVCLGTGQEQESLSKSLQVENYTENSHVCFENTQQKNKM